MAVSLSPIGGAASQFFNSNGVPLSGGKMYTYEAGTTTPKATFTSSSGLTAHSNPIVLDSAGRIPGGETWLTSAEAYLFILKSSNDTLIGTWDNILGYAAGTADAVTEVQVATADQTDFVLTTMSYTPGSNTLQIFVDGVNQVVNNAYTEVSATTVTFVSGLHVGAVVKFVSINSAATDSSLVEYTPAGTGAVVRTVQARLRETVNVTDYYDGTGATPVKDAFDRAYLAGKAVEVPADTAFTGLASSIVIPSGKDTVIYGSVTGSYGGNFTMAGDGEFFMRGGLLNNVYLTLAAGSPKVTGFRATGRAHTAAILIMGVGTYRNVAIRDFEIYGANYGILRQGVGSSLNGCSITGGQFYDLYGDAIEWNICVNDKNVQVIDHTIDLIDSTTTGNPNWGIGIGFAGSSYNNTWPDANTIKDFTIANIRGSRMRQMIHVENGNRFTIADISGYDISSTYSTTAGLLTSLLVCYACNNFEVDTVSGTDASLVAFDFGTSGGTYIAPCANFTVNNVKLTNTSFRAELGNTDSTVSISNVDINGGYFAVTERPGDLHLEHIYAKREKADGVALALSFDLNTDGRGAFRAIPSVLKMHDVNGVDMAYANSTSSTIAQNLVKVTESNVDYGTYAGNRNRSINRAYSGATNGLPYGKEFVRGDTFVDTTLGVTYACTVAGSLNRAADTFAVQDQAGRVVYSTGGYAWDTAAQHEVGQKITLSNIGVAGAPLVTSILRVYAQSAQYRMLLADDIGAVNGTTGTITATTTATLVVI